MHPNAYFWERHFRTVFIPAVKCVSDTFLDRLLPTFSSIDQEAEAMSDKKWTNLCSRPGDEDGDVDLADDAEIAADAGIEYYIAMKGIEQGILNACAVFLYHIYEQHLKCFYRKEMLSKADSQEIASDSDKSKNILNYSEWKERFRAIGIDTKTFPCWPVMEELRLLANTVKHAKLYRTTEQLHRVAPKLFERSQHDERPHSVIGASSDVFMPLLGDDIYVTGADIRKYEEAIKQFWLSLAERLHAIPW